MTGRESLKFLTTGSNFTSRGSFACFTEHKEQIRIDQRY